MTLTKLERAERALVDRMYAAAGIATDWRSRMVGGYAYNGRTVALASDRQQRAMALHDLAHWALAAAERKHVPNFGLGNNDFLAFGKEKPLTQLVDHVHGAHEEALAIEYHKALVARHFPDDLIYVEASLADYPDPRWYRKELRQRGYLNGEGVAVDPHQVVPCDPDPLVYQRNLVGVAYSVVNLRPRWNYDTLPHGGGSTAARTVALGSYWGLPAMALNPLARWVVTPQRLRAEPDFGLGRWRGALADSDIASAMPAMSAAAVTRTERQAAVLHALMAEHYLGAEVAADTRARLRLGELPCSAFENALQGLQAAGYVTREGRYDADRCLPRDYRGA